MNVISRQAILKAAAKHPEGASWLHNWYAVAKKAEWTNLHDVRAVYQAADQVGGCLIFNAPQGHRLVVGIIYATEQKGGTIFIKHYLTHAEYDKESWKKDCA